MLSVNGSLADVAAFFLMSERELKRRNKQEPPWIAFWKDGNRNVYGEEDVVRKKSERYVSDRRMQPGEAAELARREWHSHLQLRAGDAVFQELKAVQRRLEDLEASVQSLKSNVQSPGGIVCLAREAMG